MQLSKQRDRDKPKETNADVAEETADLAVAGTARE